MALNVVNKIVKLQRMLSVDVDMIIDGPGCWE